MASKQKQFKPSSAAENAFARALRKVAKYSGHIVEAHVDGAKLHYPKEMQAALKAYSELIDPWARRQAAKMLEQVSKANKRAYNQKSKLVGKLVQTNIADEHVGQVAAALMHEQVGLIKSIPVRAGERAQKLALEAVYNGTRASEVAEELKRSTKVSESQAMLIARTEVARSNAAITEARATAVGSQAYIWRTTMDGAERESHRKMNGKVVRYDSPPELSDKTVGHAGTFPNCRCYQDVLFDTD
jgi:SPP1 gp7 family putative phage head morphogenesis protein